MIRSAKYESGTRLTDNENCSGLILSDSGPASVLPAHNFFTGLTIF